MNPRISHLASLFVLTWLATPSWAANPSPISARDAAIEHRIAADAAPDTEDARASYEAASSAFQAHILHTPSDHQALWYLADTLHKLGRYAEAMEAYDTLLAEPHNHAYADGAIYMQMRSALDRIHAGHAGTDVVPDDAVVLSQAGELLVFALSDDHQAFIEAADEALHWTFAAPTAEGNAYAAALEQNRAAIAYMTAQVLFHHHHFEAVRPRLLAIIHQHPHSPEASYSAALLVDSYVLDNDLESVRAYAQQFVANPVGPSDPSLNNDTAFEALLEQATYKTCVALTEDGSDADPMTCFLGFLHAFPHSEHAPLALYSAANTAVNTGDPRAPELLRTFASSYPDHERIAAVQASLHAMAP